MTRKTLMSRVVDKWRVYGHDLNRTYRQHGVVAAATVGTQWVGRRLLRPLRMRELRSYDSKHGLDTVPDRGYRSSSTDLMHDDALHYERLTPTELKRALNSLQIDARQFTFVDLGCGKGGALLVAMELGYAACVGVEYDRHIADVASKNVEVFRAATGNSIPPVDIIVSDAARYIFPNTPCVVYLFNPFGLATMETVLENIERTLERSPRRFIVAYCNPVYREPFDRSLALRPMPVGSLRWALYDTAPSYS